MTSDPVHVETGGLSEEYLRSGKSGSTREVKEKGVGEPGRDDARGGGVFDNARGVEKLEAVGEAPGEPCSTPFCDSVLSMWMILLTPASDASTSDRRD